MAHPLTYFCMCISWIAVIVLGYFLTLSFYMPQILKIKKSFYIESRLSLTIGLISYGIFAVVCTIMIFLPGNRKRDSDIITVTQESEVKNLNAKDH